MCGIVGLWDAQHKLNGETAAAAIRCMTQSLIHRGPDDEGHFCDESAGLSLGFRRLSIVDLSPEGHQPMMSASGRYVIVFNGEVYNHGALRKELAAAGATFRGHSDTEVMLATIERYGLDGAVQRFIGMFAFALWDRRERSLNLVRDRLGIKPLYYGWAAGMFVFASELKAIRTIPGFSNPVDRDALTLLLRHNYIPAPNCIYRDLHKLPPGTLLRVDERLAGAPADTATLSARAKVYWSARAIAEAGAAGRLALPDSEAIVELDALLRDAVALRMQADVPLGAFLSGGVDSSTVVALMQAQASQPVQTFSIGFREQDFDEAQHAKAVAAHLGTDHHELYVTAQDALDVVPQLPGMFDEPFADSSQIPTHLVSKLARGKVTVSLSGDGGDELFGGYNRYFWGGRLRRWVRRVPGPVRRGLASALRTQSGFFGAALEHTSRYMPASLRLSNPRDKLGILADMLAADSDDQRYRWLVSHWRDPASMVLDTVEPRTVLNDPALRPSLADPVERMMYMDLVSYLPGDILTKVDRASMVVSLEARVPLLDHRVVEFAWRIPVHQKIRAGQGKWLLRQVLYQYVPKSLIERPKMGFGVPIDEWLRGPLRDWAESLLSEDRLRREAFFNPNPIRTKWREHLSGKRRWHYHLWDVLMFQAWMEQQSLRDSMSAIA